MKWFLNILLGCTISVFVLQLCQYFIINTLIIKIQDNIDFNDVVLISTFCLLFIYLVYQLYTKVKHNIVIDKKILNFITISWIVYLLYRSDTITHDKWQFVSIYENIKYCDSLLGISAIYYLILILKLREWIKKTSQQIYNKYIRPKNEERENTYIYNTNDSAITTPVEDLLNYYPSVKLLLERIIEGGEYYKDRAMCIGIPAPWGTGKTSYLNLLKHAVEKDKSLNCYNKAIIVKFNPWFSSNSDRIVQDFMITLSDTLNKYNPNISSELIHYSKILSKTQLGWVSTLIDICFNNKENAIEKQFTEISKCCSEIKKPIIIFIDDIDRLQPDEIMRVLQLIRNTANFKNIIFIMPYDKEYINNIITNLNINTKYLEKIFTHTHCLPLSPQEKMNKIFSNIIADTIPESAKYKEDIVSLLITLNIEINIRSTKLLSNQILETHSRLSTLGLKDIYLYDLFIIEYIKFKYTKLYNFIRDYFYQKSSDYYISINDFTFIDSNNNEVKYKECQLANNDYYQNHIDPVVKQTIHKDLGLKLLNILFEDNSKDVNSYRLKYPDIYNTYFEIITDYDFISEHNFKEAIENPKLFKAQLEKWKQLKNQDLLLRLLKNIKFTNEGGAFMLLDEYIDVFLDEYINIDISNNPFTIILGDNYYLSTNDLDYKYFYKDIVIKYLREPNQNDTSILNKKFNLLISIYNSSDLHKIFYNNTDQNFDFNEVYLSYLKHYLSLHNNLLITFFNFIYNIDLITEDNCKKEVDQLIIKYIDSNFKYFIICTNGLSKDNLEKILKSVFSKGETTWTYFYNTYLNRFSNDFSQQDWFKKHIQTLKEFWPDDF